MEMKIPTPHISASAGDFAKTVLMPGDPKRAEFIAEKYLQNTRVVNEVRGMSAITGTYKGKPISVMGSGMGIPSIGIYAYELYHFYGVESIIRVGSAGGIRKDLGLYSIVASLAASYDSNFAAQYRLPGTFSAGADYMLLRQAEIAAEKLGIPMEIGNTVTCDSFYDEKNQAAAWETMNILSVEMEAAGLYMTASAAGKRALCLMTVVDRVEGGEEVSAEQREKGLDDMILIALEAGISV